MSGTTVRPAERAGTGRQGEPSRLATWRDPAAVMIVAATLTALGLRLYQLARPGYLLGLTEYDDGPYFGSAVRLVQGYLPYRDFILVQPPGITLLMTPAALAAKLTGTAAGMAIGRLLTAAAGVASVVLAGLLVRHRGAVATVVVCGLLAVYPDGVAAAHTVLVEPWLVLICLAGALAVFDRDGLANRRRLLTGGIMFGAAGAVETWAIVPAAVITVICLTSARTRKGAAAFTGGAAAAFAVPVAPFALAAPRRFYQSLIVAQVGPRTQASRVPLWDRFKEMAGLSDTHLPGPVNLWVGHAYLENHVVIAGTVVALAAAVLGLPAMASAAQRRPPPAIESFALASALLTVAMFCWPSQFHYHFAAFLAPFLGLALGLPLARLASLAPRGLAIGTAGLATAVLAAFTAFQVRAEAGLTPLVGPQTLAQARRAIPAGSCVATDEASMLILADRFAARSPQCSTVVDGLGTDLALSGGRKPGTGAGRVRAVSAVWRHALAAARYVWLSRYNGRRIAWTPALRAYFARYFTADLSDSRGDRLYRRRPSGQRSGG